MFAKKLALAAVTAAVAAIGVTGVAQGATVGQTCQVNQNPDGWPVFVSFYWGPGGWGGSGYQVYYPDSMIIDTVPGPISYWAHVSGQASGLITASTINESTCQ